MFSRLFGFGVYLSINTLVFIGTLVIYRSRGAPLFLQIARGAGVCLDLNVALILLTVLRGSLVTLRRVVGVRSGILLASAVEWHQTIGIGIVWFSIIHGSAHVILLAKTGQGFKAPVTVTGFILLGGILGIALTSLIRNQSGRKFTLFVIVHIFALAWLGLTALHTHRVWPWLILPVSLYALDWTIRLVRGTTKHAIRKVDFIGNWMVRLEILRPLWFKHMPGDYVKIRVGYVSWYEWHPFTVTSDPAKLESMIVFIRNRGDWTSRLMRYIPVGPWTVNIQGPFSAPVNRIMTAKHAVMIATGIGVTPFAAVLEAFRAGHPRGKLERLSLYWVFREPEMLAIFEDLYATIRSEYPWIQLYLFMTSHPPHPMHGVIEQRPDWDTIFAGLRNYGSMPDIFFCGTSPLARELRKLSRTYSFTFSQESF